MPQNQSDEVRAALRGGTIPPVASPFRKGGAFGPFGVGDYEGSPQGQGEGPRAAWNSFGPGPAMKLPPLEQERAMMMERAPARYELPPVMVHSSGFSPQQHLEPLNMAVSQQSRQQAAMEERLLMLERARQQGAERDRQQAQLEERLMHMEGRLVQSERLASEASRAYDMQQQRVQALLSDVGRASAELGDLRMRYEGALSGTSQLQQQVMGMAADMRQQDAKVQGLTQQLSESLRVNAEMRGQMAMLSDEVARAAADRAAAQASVERLSRQFAEGAAHLAEEQRRAAGEANAQQREESRRQQQQYMNDLAALNREVDAYRNEAQAAGGALHSAVERLNARLQVRGVGEVGNSWHMPFLAPPYECD